MGGSQSTDLNTEDHYTCYAASKEVCDEGETCDTTVNLSCSTFTDGEPQDFLKYVSNDKTIYTTFGENDSNICKLINKESTGDVTISSGDTEVTDQGTEVNVTCINLFETIGKSTGETESDAAKSKYYSDASGEGKWSSCMDPCSTILSTELEKSPDANVVCFDLFSTDTIEYNKNDTNTGDRFVKQNTFVRGQNWISGNNFSPGENFAPGGKNLENKIPQGDATTVA
jgi:hypothetical protein